MRRRPIPSLTDTELHIMLHALGVQQRGGKWSRGGWRNHFSTAPTCDDYETCLDLNGRGWLAPSHINNPTRTFHVTEAGEAALILAGWPIDTREGA